MHYCLQKGFGGTIWRERWQRNAMEFPVSFIGNSCKGMTWSWVTATGDGNTNTTTNMFKATDCKCNCFKAKCSLLRWWPSAIHCFPWLLILPTTEIWTSQRQYPAPKMVTKTKNVLSVLPHNSIAQFPMPVSSSRKTISFNQYKWYLILAIWRKRPRCPLDYPLVSDMSFLQSRQITLIFILCFQMDTYWCPKTARQHPLKNVALVTMQNWQCSIWVGYTNLQIFGNAPFEADPEIVFLGTAHYN